MPRLALFLPLLALAGCASVAQQQARVDHALLGRPLSAVAPRLGTADSLSGGKTPLVQYDLYRGTGAALVNHTSTFYGYAGSTPVSGSVTSSSAYAYDTHCILMIQTDQQGIVTWTRLDGDASSCRKGLKGVL